MSTDIHRLIRVLRQKKLTLGFAESCTGGMLSSAVTDIAGVSDVFMGGVVSYSNAIKNSVLGVDDALLRAYGAVSAECAEAMARGAAQVLGVDVAASVTGIAGPSGGSVKKPVGLVYGGFYVCGQISSECFDFSADDVSRAHIRQCSVQAIISGLLHRIDKL